MGEVAFVEDDTLIRPGADFARLDLLAPDETVLRLPSEPFNTRADDKVIGNLAPRIGTTDSFFLTTIDANFDATLAQTTDLMVCAVVVVPAPVFRTAADRGILRDSLESLLAEAGS